MVKRYDFDIYAGGAVDEDDGWYVLHSDYAALQASHDRLLEALNRVVQADDDQTLDGDDIESAREAIAAAKPFTET